MFIDAGFPKWRFLLGAFFGMWAWSQGVINEEGPLNRVRLTTQGEANLLAENLGGDGFDILWHSITENSVDVVVSKSEWRRLEELGLKPRLVEQGRPFRDILAERGTVPAGYKNLAEIVLSMTETADAFPHIARLVNLNQTYGLPKTFEGRDIYALKISDNPALDEDEPNALIVSAHHCREIVTPVIALHAIDQLTQMYGVSPEITDLVNSYEIWIAPIWNPDGYEAVFNVDNFWRKNRRIFPAGIGVDLNRNYPFGWDSICGGSSSVASNTYRGPEKASEPETRLMMHLSQERHFAKVLDFHSSGREVLWGYSCHDHPLEGFLQQEGTTMSDEAGYLGDNRSPSAEGEHFEWQLAEGTAHAFLMETHTSFQPDFASATAEATQVWPGILWLLKRPISLSGHISDKAGGGPLAATLTNLSINYLNGEQIRTGGPFNRFHLFLPPGTFQIEFRAQGFQAQIRSIDVNADSAQVLELVAGAQCLGDLDQSLMVDVLDYTDILNALGQSNVPQDINGDGQVDFSDLEAVLDVWGGCP